MLHPENLELIETKFDEKSVDIKLHFVCALHSYTLPNEAALVHDKRGTYSFKVLLHTNDRGKFFDLAYRGNFKKFSTTLTVPKYTSPKTLIDMGALSLYYHTRKYLLIDWESKTVNLSTIQYETTNQEPTNDHTEEKARGDYYNAQINSETTRYELKCNRTDNAIFETNITGDIEIQNVEDHKDNIQFNIILKNAPEAEYKHHMSHATIYHIGFLPKSDTKVESQTFKITIPKNNYQELDHVIVYINNTLMNLYYDVFHHTLEQNKDYETEIKNNRYKYPTYKSYLSSKYQSQHANAQKFMTMYANTASQDAAMEFYKQNLEQKVFKYLADNFIDHFKKYSRVLLKS
jgi:hypothetical protein